jgi:predicted transcriptional regulator of viral defense system
MNALKSLLVYENQVLNTAVLLGVLKNYKRPYDKIGEWVDKGNLIQLKKGLYIIGPEISDKTPEPFLMANHIYGPSYISLDSGLAYWGLIPERAYATTSCTMKKSKSFSINGSSFSYLQLSKSYFPLGIKTITIATNQTVLIGCPEKCLFDKIITTSGIHIRSKKQAAEFLFEDLRIEADSLKDFNIKEIQTWLSVAPKEKSLNHIIDLIHKL